MSNVSSKRIVLNALMIALVFLATRFTSIPGPVGYFNIGDVVIMISAILLGRNCGFLAGAVGSAFADLASGYAIFAPVTFIVKGLEGYVTGLIASYEKGRNPGELLKIIAVVIGAVVMVAGYFAAEMYVMGLFAPNFGYVAAVKDLLPNLIQGIISSVISYAIVSLLVRINIRRYL